MSDLNKADVMAHGAYLNAMGVSATTKSHWVCVKRFVRTFCEVGLQKVALMRMVESAERAALKKGGNLSDGRR